MLKKIVNLLIAGFVVSIALAFAVVAEIVALFDRTPPAADGDLTSHWLAE